MKLLKVKMEWVYAISKIICGMDKIWYKDHKEPFYYVRLNQEEYNKMKKNEVEDE